MTTMDDIAALLRQQNELLHRFLLISEMPVATSQTTSAKSANDQRAENAFRKMAERRSKK